MSKSFLELGISKRKSNSCSCGKVSYIYTLPMGLDESIIAPLEFLGKPSLSFEKTRILKIGTLHFFITGIKFLKEIRFTVKTDKGNAYLLQFEKALSEYIENHPRLKRG